MANTYETNSVTVSREDPKFFRTIPVAHENFNAENLAKAATYGIWLKASADCASKLPKGTSIEVRTSTIAERVAEICALGNLERERAEVSRIYEDGDMITAIGSAMKVDPTKARAIYAKTYAGLTSKAEVLARSQEVIAKQPKIAAAYAALKSAKSAEVNQEEGIDLLG